MAFATNLTRPSICDERGIAPGTWNSWFPFYEDILQAAVATCVQKLHDAPQQWGIAVGAGSIPGCPDYFDLISCANDELPSQVSLAMASAQVILGLTPTFISTLSPTVGEVSMLSANRPVLSFMISLGCPALFSLRSLEYDDPLALIQWPGRSIFRRRPSKQQAWVSALQYLLVLAAIANVIIADGQLGYNTINVWVAGRPYLVYIWSISAIVPHGFSAVAFYLSRSARAVRRLNEQQRLKENKDGWLHARFSREVTVCAAKHRRGYIEHQVDEPSWVIALSLVASFMGYALIIYGTILFPSLLFIGPLDAFTIIMRYFGSTVVCRMILLYELNGIIAVESAG